VLSNTAASSSAFAVGANALSAFLPPGVDDVLREHEEVGTTDDPAYEAACDVSSRRHLCRLDPWPDELARSFDLPNGDPTVHHVTNGPSEFHIVGSFKDVSFLGRLNQIRVPTLVISGRHDEATPELQEELVRHIAGAEQVLLEESSHMPLWEQRSDYMAAVGDFLRRHD
jgi:L-proline amide hydrolase